jgi:hypothetical protein
MYFFFSSVSFESMYCYFSTVSYESSVAKAPTVLLRDANIPASSIQKYLVQKLSLPSESDVRVILSVIYDVHLLFIRS